MKEGAELEEHYRKALEALGKEKGMLGVIFRTMGPWDGESPPFQQWDDFAL